jgi:hypothetical protein
MVDAFITHDDVEVKKISDENPQRGARKNSARQGQMQVLCAIPSLSVKQSGWPLNDD